MEKIERSLDFAQELDDLIKDYLSWGSNQPMEQRRADAIKALEEHLAALKSENE
jgi:hypothetical protein